MKRRAFATNSALTSLGFFGLQRFIMACSNPAPTKNLKSKYGALVEDKKGLLNLPKQFSYKIISRRGDKMDDGFYVPGLADGMATFQGPNGTIVVVRNHEVSPRDIKNGAFGKKMELLKKLPKESFYDFGRGVAPCLGGTTTMVYDPVRKKVKHQYLSLVGTIRNCAGGPTPWNSWISCEENTNKADNILEKDHGYNFEVPALTDGGITFPKPIKSMGRFNHEAVCVDPRTGIVYQTEDRSNSLIYRYIPKTYGDLASGGKLQALAIKDQLSADTRNWDRGEEDRFETGNKYDVRWIDLDEIDAPDDDLRYRGHEKGAAVFARGEGMWFGNGEVFFACTNGGREGLGQIFRYSPSLHEGTAKENNNPATLELFIESNDSELLESCDNVTVASNGDLVICEDKSVPKIVGVTPAGEIYHLAKNIGYRSEFAGAVFSPDGRTLFVNIQGPGITLAIEGPWS